MSYCDVLRLEGDLVERKQQSVSTEEHRVQVDQQLQEGLSLSRTIAVDAEARACSSYLIGQKSAAEIPQLLHLDSFQQLLQADLLL